MDNGEAIGMMAGAYFVGRGELLRWINELTSLNYTKIEQTASGVFVCHVFDALFPGEVRLEKVNFNARQQYEYVQNYKILQAAFKRLSLKKEIDVEKLIKGKYQDNLEFIQWVKAFYDSHASEHALQYDGRTRREEIISRRGGAHRPALVSNRPRKTDGRARGAGPRVVKTRSAGPTHHRPAHPTVKKTEFDALKAENERLEQVIADGENEREFYFGKLRTVELIIQDLEEDFATRGHSVDDVTLTAMEQIKAALYAEDDVSPQEEDADPAGSSDEQHYAEEDLPPEESAHEELIRGEQY